MKVVVLRNLEPVVLDEIILMTAWECLAVCIPEKDLAFLMGCLPEDLDKKIAHLQKKGVDDLLRFGYGQSITEVEDFLNPTECVAEFEVEIEE